MERKNGQNQLEEKEKQKESKAYFFCWSTLLKQLRINSSKLYPPRPPFKVPVEWNAECLIGIRDWRALAILQNTNHPIPHSTKKLKILLPTNWFFYI